MKRCNRYVLAVFFVSSLCVALFSAREGLRLVETRDTDPVSEEQAVVDAHEIFQGNHTWGIVKYAHYPNGPSYALLPAFNLGFTEYRDLRMFPVIVSGISLGVLCFGLMVSGRSLFVSPLCVVVVLALLRQPGVSAWMGALHEHSYALSLCFLAMGLSLFAKVGAKTLFCLGFISGWIGYDFTFCFFFSVATCRWLVHLRGARYAWSVVRGSLIDCTASVLGIGMAIVAHLVQNSFVLGGLGVAVRDLLGSAAARAALPIAADLNPEYNSYIQAAHQGVRYPRGVLVRDLLQQFWAPEWVDSAVLEAAFFFLFAAVLLVLLLRTRQALVNGVGTRAVVVVGALYAFSLVLISLSGVTWFMIMPDHARFHFHFIQRHFFVPTALLGVVAIEIIGRCWGSGVGKSKSSTESKEPITSPPAA